MTAAGTKPGDRPAVATSSSAAPAATTRAGAGRVTPSARYTPPIPKELRESPPWLPILMLALFIVGGLAIMARYLVWPDSNIPMLVGLACLLGGLFTATRWR